MNHTSLKDHTSFRLPALLRDRLSSPPCPPPLLDVSQMFAASSGRDPEKGTTDRGGTLAMTVDHSQMSSLCLDGPAKRRRELGPQALHPALCSPCSCRRQMQCSCFCFSEKTGVLKGLSTLAPHVPSARRLYANRE